MWSSDSSYSQGHYAAPVSLLPYSQGMLGKCRGGGATCASFTSSLNYAGLTAGVTIRSHGAQERSQQLWDTAP